MTLYVSNPTRQDVSFQYRIPIEGQKEWSGGDRGGPFILNIPSGQQRPLTGDLSPAQKAAVIKQLELHGARNAAEVYGKMPGFMGLIWRDEGVISEDEIRLANEAVEEAQQDRSVQQATRSALAADRGAKDSLRRARNGIAPPRATSIEVEEVRPPYAKKTGKEVHLGVEVSPDGRSDVSLPV